MKKLESQENSYIMERLFHRDFIGFCQESNIRLALLFGSQVTGRARYQSDFDLAVLLDKEYPKEVLARGKEKRTLIRKFSTHFSSSRIDLVILNDASSFLVYQVVQTGTVLYEARSGEFARLASLAIRQYSDGRLFREVEKKFLAGQV